MQKTVYWDLINSNMNKRDVQEGCAHGLYRVCTQSSNTGVTVCLPLPLSPHPYMVLPVSQSLLVQSLSALCLDYVPGVSSYVSLYKSVLPHVTCGLLLMSACKPVSMFVPVFLCLLRLSFIKMKIRMKEK